MSLLECTCVNITHIHAAVFLQSTARKVRAPRHLGACMRQTMGLFATLMSSGMAHSFFEAQYNQLCLPAYLLSYELRARKYHLLHTNGIKIQKIICVNVCVFSHGCVLALCVCVCVCVCCVSSCLSACVCVYVSGNVCVRMRTRNMCVCVCAREHTRAL
jgi:hypothetical protein